MARPMRSCSVRVIFSTVVNKGGQFGSPVGNRKWLDDARQTKGRKGCNLLISQFEAFVEICIADRSKFKYPRYCQSRPCTWMVQHQRSEMPTR